MLNSFSHQSTDLSLPKEAGTGSKNWNAARGIAQGWGCHFSAKTWLFLFHWIIVADIYWTLAMFSHHYILQTSSHLSLTSLWAIGRIIIISFHQWENQGTESFSNLPQIPKWQSWVLDPAVPKPLLRITVSWEPSWTRLPYILCLWYKNKKFKMAIVPILQLRENWTSVTENGILKTLYHQFSTIWF